MRIVDINNYTSGFRYIGIQYLFLLLTLILSKTLPAQAKTHVYFLNNNMEDVPKEKATLIGMGKQEQTYIRRIFDLQNNVIRKEEFTDSTMKVRHGRQLFYQKNGPGCFIVEYKNNMLDGITTNIDSLGHVTDSAIYEGNKMISKRKFIYDREGYLKTKKTTDSLSDKYFEETFDMNGKLIELVEFIGNKGTEKKLNAEGNFVLTDTYDTRKSTIAEYTEDEKVFTSKFVASMEKSSAGYNIPPGKYRVIIVFTVNKEGVPTKFKALSNNGYGLEENLIKVIKNGGLWIPASRYGRKVDCDLTRLIVYNMSGK